MVRLRSERNKGETNGIKKCGKARYQMCEFVDEVNAFGVNGRTYQIN